MDGAAEARVAMIKGRRSKPTHILFSVMYYFSLDSIMVVLEFVSLTVWVQFPVQTYFGFMV